MSKKQKKSKKSEPFEVYFPGEEGFDVSEKDTGNLSSMTGKKKKKNKPEKGAKKELINAFEEVVKGIRNEPGFDGASEKDKPEKDTKEELIAAAFEESVKRLDSAVKSRYFKSKNMKSRKFLEKKMFEIMKSIMGKERADYMMRNAVAKMTDDQLCKAAAVMAERLENGDYTLDPKIMKKFGMDDLDNDVEIVSSDCITVETPEEQSRCNVAPQRKVNEDGTWTEYNLSVRGTGGNYELTSDRAFDAFTTACQSIVMQHAQVMSRIMAVNLVLEGLSKIGSHGFGLGRMR